MRVVKKQLTQFNILPKGSYFEYNGKIWLKTYPELAATITDKRVSKFEALAKVIYLKGFKE